MWLSSIHPRTKQHFLKSLNAQFGHSVFIDALVNLALCHFGQLHVGAVIWSAGHYSPTQQTRCPVEAHESESSLVKKNMELTTENNTFEIGQDTFFCQNKKSLGEPPQMCALFVWLISYQPVVFFSQNKSANSNQSVVLFSQNKSLPATSQTNGQVDPGIRTGGSRIPGSAVDTTGERDLANSTYGVAMSD
jgi:hypothetical protein